MEPHHTTVSDLFERDRELSILTELLADVQREREGRLVLIGGEAGVGKTALLRHFCERPLGSARILWGACDALFTPRPLGPLLDVADTTGGELEALVESGARPHEVLGALARELKASAPTVLVIEDAHWADEATLDVLMLLVRRIEAVPVYVLVSYRDDELGREHPLRLVLGEFATSAAVSRLKIHPLSETAVAELAKPAGVDAGELYRKTAGNPFFVTEALAAGREIPETVMHAVLARAGRLTRGGRTLVEAVAVVPPQAELWLLESLSGDDLDCLDECLLSGMLVELTGGVGFRHELARLAIEESLAPNRKLALHRTVLAALEAAPGGTSDLARIAHHAERAGDSRAVLQFAPAAGARAASLGAAREAAAQYARALRFADGLELKPKVELLERAAYASYLIGDFEAAIDSQERAIECHRQLVDHRGEGDSLRSLSRLLRYLGRNQEAMELGREAVAVLETLHPGRELAMAYCNVSHLYMNAEDIDGTLVWGERALELARQLNDDESSVYALINIATTDLLAGVGAAKIERCLELAQRAGLEEHAGRAFVALTWWRPRGRAYADGDRYLEPGLEYCGERGLDLWRPYLLAYRARSLLDRGSWGAAVDSASLVLQDPRTSPMPRIVALSVLGLARARRGDPDVWAPLEEAWALAEPTGELQRLEPVAAARAEALWLEGRESEVAAATDAVLELAVRRRASWIVGELAFWRRCAGIQEKAPVEAAEPWATQLADDSQGAARRWSDINSPYEAALALGGAGDEHALRRSFEDLQSLGAHPAAAIVAQRLRRRGARGVPRGPRPATRDNPAGLTMREAQVLELVAQGLRNVEIAERLFVSEKTVNHHVSAILRKLQVRTRVQAAAEAERLGLFAQDQ
jgi:DNA-binding CsgD family transcriptional regulator/tetratricopeptide (TPR) repeat protein